jgi:chitinase
VKTPSAILLVLMLAAPAPARCQSREIWVSAYYPGWRQSRLSPADIDFGALTHLVQFSVVPRKDGSLDALVNMMTTENIKAAVSAAHGAGKKILFAVGGQDTREQFVGAMSQKHLAAFIAALVSFMRENGYDGIDVDMEPVTSRDAPDYARFIRGLRAKLDGITPRPLLSAAVLWEPGLFAKLAANFDQINLMSYNLSGPYPGWVVWHSGALYDGGRRFPNSRANLPSVDGLVAAFLAAGVPKDKLGIGLSFNGYVWSGGGVRQPGQEWTTPPTMENVPYYLLAQTYDIRENDDNSPGYHWDSRAQAAYLSIAATGTTEAKFISYDNEVTAAKMIQYARGRGIGGLIVWDIGAGYRADQPPGRRDALLQAVKQSRLGAQGGAP